MRPDPIEGKPRRKLIAVTRTRVALAAAAVLAALWLAIVGQLKAGNDPVIKDTASGAAAPATTGTTTTTETTPQTETSSKTETTETQTQTTTTSTSTATTSQS